MPPSRSGRLARVLRVLRFGAAVVLILALFPTVLTLCAGFGLRQTVGRPGYVMDVVRQADVIEAVKADFLDGLVESSGVEPAAQAALREALDEGVTVVWLDAQLERILTGLEAYLVSDGKTTPTIELPLVELKITLLQAIQEHMGQEYYLQAALGLQSVPDSVDVGSAFDLESLRRIRPYWRAATQAPWLAGGAAFLLSAFLWLVTGRGAKGMAAVGGVWAAAGLVLTALAGTAEVAAATVLPAALPLSLPELQSVPLRAMASTGLAGLCSELLAVGTGTLLAGCCALSLPGTGRMPGRGKRGGPSSRNQDR